MGSYLICVVLVDDYLVMLVGVEYGLLLVLMIQLIGKVVNLIELIWFVEVGVCDVVVFDYVMFGSVYGDGIMLFFYFQCNYLVVKLVVLIMFDNLVVIGVLMWFGIECIVSKFDMIDYLIFVIYVVVMGGLYFLLLVEKVVCMFMLYLSVWVVDQKCELSDCEFEVVWFYVLGFMVNEIVDKFSCSKKMISMQKVCVMEKFGIGKDIDLLCYVIEYGIVVVLVSEGWGGDLKEEGNVDLV